MCEPASAVQLEREGEGGGADVGSTEDRVQCMSVDLMRGNFFRDTVPFVM